MWYRFEEGNPFGVWRVKQYQVCWYDMDMGGNCFDESFYKPNEIDKVIDRVETVEDEDHHDRTRVFVHFDNGDLYELKLEKLDETRRHSNFYDGCDEESLNEFVDNWEDFEDDDNEYENDTMKFIWGVKSWDDLCAADVCLYTMNDIDLIYLKDKKKYVLSIETIFSFDKEKYKLDYLKRLLDAFTVFMKNNNYDTETKPYWMDVFTYGWNMNTEFDSIEECYATFKMLVNGYCSLYENCIDE